MMLYLDIRTHKITDEKDREVSVDNARAFWLAGKVKDCNLSFERLSSLNFDFDALDKSPWDGGAILR